MPSKHKTCTGIHIFANKIYLKYFILLRILQLFNYLILVWENENEITFFCKEREKKRELKSTEVKYFWE